MLEAFAFSWLILSIAGCGTRSTLDVGEGTGGSSTTSSASGPVPCGADPCAADQLCFHPWQCTDAACSTACPCTCGTLPASCPADMPCSCPGTGPFGGYFGNPGEVFSGPDAGAAFPDHQVACYGS